MPEHHLHNEPELLQRIAEGEEEAFKILYDHYDRVLKPYLLQLTRSERDTSDLIQETMLRVWLNRERIHQMEHPGAYIYRIAGNRAYSWLKSTMIRDHHEKQVIIPHNAETDSQSMVHEISALVQQTVREMPEQRRRIYLMNREQDMKPATIAQALDISLSTVNNTLYQAIKTIRERVEKAGYLLPLWLVLFLV